MNKLYPIAERFTSIQGEGLYTGTLMRFIRLAGCNVGKYHSITDELAGEWGYNEPDRLRWSVDDVITKPRHSFCTTCTGERFLCDTDYNKHEEWDIPGLRVDCLEVEHICITGGEPFLHDLRELINILQQDGKTVHIETSGTVDFRDQVKGLLYPPWITCSPKQGFLDVVVPYINEYKLLIGTDTDPATVLHWLSTYDIPHRDVYLQPINRVNEPVTANYQKVFDIIKENPELQLSAQLHKFLKWS